MAKNPAYWEPSEAWLVKHKQDIRAVQATYSGAANDDQQLRTMMFIMDTLCERNSNQYHPTDRDTAFALGKKFVADMIAGALNVNISDIDSIEEKLNNERISRKPR